MSFISSIWLWGLVGLAIPIGIHLLSRKEGKTIYIGSLRHLIDSNTTRFSSLRPNEILLLLLRAALIVLVVFLLAGLLMPFTNQPDKKWLLVEKGIENDQDLKSVIDSLQNSGFEMRFLSKRFPIISDSTSVRPITNYNALLADLANDHPDEAVILSYTFADHFKGQRTPLLENVQWIGVEPKTKNFIHSVTKLQGDSLKIRLGQTSAMYTTFKTKLVRNTQGAGSVYHHERDTATISPTRSLNVRVFFSKPFEKDMNLIAASLAAIASEIQVSINIAKENTSNYSEQTTDLDLWISDEPLPAQFKNGIAFRKCAETNHSILMPANQAALFCNHAKAADWVITKRVTQENILTENFTLTLAKIIRTKLRPNDQSFSDHRTLPTALAWSKAANETNVKTSGESPLETYLAVLLLLTLVAERWVAFKRNQ
jgi:hypothetical protein